MQPEELPSWAEQQAAALLSGLGDRWTHVKAVAAQARQVSIVLAPEDRPYLVAAAWLHDIGYAPALNRLGFHPVDGSRYVRQLGQERLASLVAYHSGARFEAEERGLVDALAEFAREDGPLLDALTYAGLHPAVLATPAVPGGLGDLQCPQDLGQVLAVVEQPLALADLADRLLGGMPVSLHVIVLLPTVWAIGLSQQMDQSQGLTSRLRRSFWLDRIFS